MKIILLKSVFVILIMLASGFLIVALGFAAAANAGYGMGAVLVYLLGFGLVIGLGTGLYYMNKTPLKRIKLSEVSKISYSKERCYFCV